MGAALGFGAHSRAPLKAQCSVDERLVAYGLRQSQAQCQLGLAIPFPQGPVVSGPSPLTKALL